MSAAPLRAAPQRAPSRAPQATPRRRDHLRAVSAPRPGRSIVGFAWLCVSIVVAALATVLILNTAMAAGSYDARDLRIEIAQLHQERATVLTQLEANAAPGALAAGAAALGMEPASGLGYITLEDQSVVAGGGR